MNRGKMIVISGPSGAGKGTLVKLFRQKHPDAWLSVSATTRKERPGEIDGVHYHFLSQREFDDMVKRDEFLEYVQYNGRSYGTPRLPLERARAQNRPVIVEIEVRGALAIKARCPEAILVFVAVNKMEELEKRLRHRGDTKEEDIQKRLQTARWEYAQMDQYDYIVCNDGEVACAAEELFAIYTAECCRAKCRIDHISL